MKHSLMITCSAIAFSTLIVLALPTRSYAAVYGDDGIVKRPIIREPLPITHPISGPISIPKDPIIAPNDPIQPVTGNPVSAPLHGDDLGPLTIDSEGTISHNPISTPVKVPTTAPATYGKSTWTPAIRQSEWNSLTTAQKTDWVKKNPVGTLPPTPITISLPAAGNIKQLANGMTMDANGLIKDPTGKLVAQLTDKGTFVNAAGQALPANLQSSFAQLASGNTGIVVQNAENQLSNTAHAAVGTAANQLNNAAGVNVTGIATSLSSMSLSGSDQTYTAENTIYKQANDYVAKTDKGDIVYSGSGTAGGLNIADVARQVASAAAANNTGSTASGTVAAPAPVTASIPASGTVKSLNGYTIDSKGNVTSTTSSPNSKGVMVPKTTTIGKISPSGQVVGADGKAVSSALQTVIQQVLNAPPSKDPTVPVASSPTTPKAPISDEPIRQPTTPGTPRQVER